MTEAESPAARLEQTDLAGMLATLCSYENFFGPFHPQTLMLATALAAEYRRAGEMNQARRLLDKVLTDSARHLSPEHAARLAAIEALRDLLLTQGDFERGAAAQRELLECRIRRFGNHHPDTLAAHSLLCDILMGNGVRNIPPP